MNDNGQTRPDGLPSLIRLIADRAQSPLGHKAKVCLFLGAGADFSSGGLSFADLKRQAIEEFLRQPVFDLTRPEQIEERFESLFLSLPPDDRALLVEALFRRLSPLQPSDAYKLLVLLAEAGGVDAVITTNFDLMLEHAQSLLGRDVFQVFAPGFARPYLITHARYELPKKPYLKLHGDLASRSVILLTATELESSPYDSSMVDLLKSILSTHDLVISGYSGSDPSLARLLADGLVDSSRRVFWCSPEGPRTDSPLYSRLAHRVTNVRATFDTLMMEVARPVLERPTLAPTEPTYLRCLFDWRVDYCNREYINIHGQRSGKPATELLARRPAIEDHLTSFLLSDRPLAIVAGPSGFGKTAIGIRLQRTRQMDDTTRVLLIRSKALGGEGDIEQYVVEQLGGLGSRSPLTLFRLEAWLREHQLRLILFIDGINEFSHDLARCVQLFRTIVRLCYFLPEARSALRVVVTVRQESWNAMLPQIDLGQLRKTLWDPGDGGSSTSTLSCGPFDDDELRDALARLREHGDPNLDFERLSPGILDRLRDPYLLALVSQAVPRGLPAMPSARLYQQAFEARLLRRDSMVDAATLKSILSTTALLCLSSQQDRFRVIDIEPAALRFEVLRVTKDLGMVVDAGEGFLQFDHDRTFEYFLAHGFSTGGGPSLETLEDLRAFLRTFKTHSKAVGAARLYFQLAPRERFGRISAALRTLDVASPAGTQAGDEPLFGFAQEVLMEMVEQGEPLAEQYLKDAVDARRSAAIGSRHFRAVVHAASALPIERAVPLLTQAAHPSAGLAGTEAAIYVTDRLVAKYLSDGCVASSILDDQPYSQFFADGSLTPWQRLGRLFRFAMQLGPDNTHPTEYAKVRLVLDAALDRCLQSEPWDSGTVRACTEYFLAHCDRLLFNATPHGINRFFGNPARLQMAPIVEKLAAGAPLDESDFLVLEPYTQTLGADIEYHSAHALFALSSLNHLDSTLRLAEQRFRGFSNLTPPVEIDFMQGVLVYLHILHGLTYDEERFGWWDEVILRSWPDVLMYRPGVERGERRGFADSFDRVFEDGFGVIYPYGVLLPGTKRRETSYADYRRRLRGETTTQLPLYTRHLERFLADNRIDEAIQVLQALAGVIVVWPVEGLLSLRGVVGHAEPRIRRASIRILAEAYGRHPDETLQFLKSGGAAITDEELLTIKVRQDARVGRRQVEVEEWARLAHFLAGRKGFRRALVAALEVLLASPTIDDAVAGIAQSLGLAAAAER